LKGVGEDGREEKRIIALELGLRCDTKMLFHGLGALGTRVQGRKHGSAHCTSACDCTVPPMEKAFVKTDLQIFLLGTVEE
jgi:hypothetical protein